MDLWFDAICMLYSWLSQNAQDSAWIIASNGHVLDKINDSLLYFVFLVLFSKFPFLIYAISIFFNSLEYIIFGAGAA